MVSDRAASTGLRKYWAMIAVPSFASITGANAASTTKVLRHSMLSVTHTWSNPVCAAVAAMRVSSVNDKSRYDGRCNCTPASTRWLINRPSLIPR